VTTVVKLGGSLLENAALRQNALKAVAARWTAGRDLVLVHGGGKRIDATLAALGIPRRVHEGLRVTDAPTLDVVVSVLSGLVNKSLVAELRGMGVTGAGISGADGDTLFAEYHPRLLGVDLGFVGTVARADPKLVSALLGSDLLPVLASVAVGRDGTLLNVNADAAAAALAGALAAERLVFLTDVEGLLDSDGRVVPSLDAARARRLLSSETVKGGMRPKLQACLAALVAGVREVLIAGPSRHESVLMDGIGGTTLVAA
jgi:acetylglutamate kinase